MRIAWLIFAVVSVAAGAEPLALKSLAPGMTAQELDVAHPGFAERCAEWKRPPFGVHCDYGPSTRAGRPAIPTLDTLAGAPVDLWLVSIRDGQVVTISRKYVLIENFP